MFPGGVIPSNISTTDADVALWAWLTGTPTIMHRVADPNGYDDCQWKVTDPSFSGSLYGMTISTSDKTESCYALFYGGNGAVYEGDTNIPYGGNLVAGDWTWTVGEGGVDLPADNNCWPTGFRRTDFHTGYGWLFRTAVDNGDGTWTTHMVFVTPTNVTCADGEV